MTTPDPTTPTPVTTPPVAVPTFAATDPSSWVAVLTVVAAVLLNVFHTDVTPYVPAAATLAAGLVMAFHLFSKHQVAAAVVTTNPTVTTTTTTVPDPQLALKVGELSRTVTELAQLVTK